MPSLLIEEPAGGFRGLTEGVPPIQRPLSAPSVIKNLWLKDFPQLSSRPGTTQVGADLGTTRALGLVIADKVNTDGTITRRLISGEGTTWKIYADGGSWTNLATGMTASRNLEGAMFGNSYVALTNKMDNPKKYDFSTVTDLISDGAAIKFGQIFSGYNRLFGVMVDANPSKLYASGAGDGTKWYTSSGYDAGDKDIHPGDGDYLTWGMLWQRMVLLWKSRHFYILQGPESGYSLSKWTASLVGPVGTPSGRTVQTAGGALYWLSRGGIAEWRGGDSPEIITRRDNVGDTIANINWASINNACAGTTDQGQVYLLAVPTGQNIYPDTVITYDTRRSSFSTWTSSVWKPLVFTQFLLGMKLYTLFGDNTGKVWRIDY